MNHFQLRQIGFVIALALVSQSKAGPPKDPEWIARGKSEMVAADSEYASTAGLAMLEAGGNAIDAAVAVSFALGVTRPYSTGLGGGGFMIVRMAGGYPMVLDFRETAPAASTPDMFVKAKEKNPGAPSPSEFGFLGVAVPGLLAGRCETLKQWGTLPLEKVLEPAIKLARDGFPVDDDYVRTTKEVLADYEKHPSLKEIGGYVYRTHLNNGKLHAVGDKLFQPELARLIEGIAKDGPDFFYKGKVAADIAAAMKRHGGIITEKDLADYKPFRNQAYVSTYRDYKLILMPLPSSGGIAIAESLNILEHFDVSATSKANPALAVHLQIEAIKHAFADRARMPTTPGTFLSKPYAKLLASQVDPERTTDFVLYGMLGLSLLKDSGTSHFSIVDRHENAVVSTETINTSFGSLAAIEEWGLVLNNEMDDFTTVLGEPNAFGLVQSSSNEVRPGSRPLSSMSPTIVLKDDKVHMLIGASGGPRIITSILNVLLRVLDEGKSLEEAVLALRPHHQLEPHEVFFDKEPDGTVAQALQSRGHELAAKRKTGVVQAIMRDGDGWVGASDPRKGGKPAGR